MLISLTRKKTFINQRIVFSQKAIYINPWTKCKGLNLQHFDPHVIKTKFGGK